MRLGVLLCMVSMHMKTLMALQSTSPLEHQDLLEQFAQHRRQQEQLKQDRITVNDFLKSIRSAWINAQSLTSKHALAQRLLNYASHKAVIQEWRELNEQVALYENYRQRLLKEVIDNGAKEILQTSAPKAIRLLATELESNKEKVHTEPRNIVHPGTHTMRTTPSYLKKIVREKKPLPSTSCELEPSMPEHLLNGLLDWELVSPESQGMANE